MPRPRSLSAVGSTAPAGPSDDDPDRTLGAVTPGEGVDRETVLAEDGVDEALLTSLEHHGILRPDVSGQQV